MPHIASWGLKVATDPWWIWSAPKRWIHWWFANSSRRTQSWGCWGSQGCSLLTRKYMCKICNGCNGITKGKYVRLFNQRWNAYVVFFAYFEQHAAQQAEQGDCIRLGSCLSKGHQKWKTFVTFCPYLYHMYILKRHLWYPGLALFCASNAPIWSNPHPWYRSPWTFSAVEGTNLPTCPKFSTWILFLRGVAWQS